MTVGYALAFSGWLYIYMAVQARRRHGELLREMREAKLHTLTAQLNPHFLFNSLNSIRALIVERPSQAASMVTSLADLLRYSLASDRQRTVRLADELAIVDEYIALEQTRFEERLRIERAVDPATLEAHVPTMLVQTLVENAVKHGIAASPGGGRVRLHTTIDGRTLRIVVTNTGTFEPPTDRNGYGLRNASERLRLIYGVAASLSVQPSGDDTIATVSIPVEAVR